MKRALFDRRRLPAGANVSQWTAPDGWRCRRLDWIQPEKAAARGSLIFAGGRGDFIEKYVEALAHWHEQGWNVTAFDWRGQGASRGESGALAPLDILTADLEALIGEWRTAMPGPHVSVAHSMGGHVLLRLLAERRAVLDAAVLVAPMLRLNSAPLPEWGASWVASTASWFGLGGVPAWHQPDPRPPFGSFRQAALTRNRERYEDELWWWERHPDYNLGAPSWGWLQQAYRSMAGLDADKLRTIRTPILLVGADKDRLVSPSAIRRAAQAIPGAELLMFPDAGHEILREEDSVRLPALSRIDHFLEEHRGA